MNLSRREEATRSWWADPRMTHETLGKQAEAERARMNRSREERLVMPVVIAWSPKVSGKWR